MAQTPRSHHPQQGGRQNEQPDETHLLPFNGWRHAGLVGRYDKKGRLVEIAFEAMNQPDIFGVDDHAVCREKDHPAPADRCRCGFYSLKDRNQVVAGGYAGYGARFHNVLLKVSLSGTVIEGENGIRASHQTVRRIEIPNRCVFNCDKEAEYVVAQGTAAIVPGSKWQRLAPACYQHAKAIDILMGDIRRRAGRPHTLSTPIRHLEHIAGVPVRAVPPERIASRTEEQIRAAALKQAIRNATIALAVPGAAGAALLWERIPQLLGEGAAYTKMAANYVILFCVIGLILALIPQLLAGKRWIPLALVPTYIAAGVITATIAALIEKGGAHQSAGIITYTIIGVAAVANVYLGIGKTYAQSGEEGVKNTLALRGTATALLAVHFTAPVWTEIARQLAA